MTYWGTVTGVPIEHGDTGDCPLIDAPCDIGCIVGARSPFQGVHATGSLRPNERPRRSKGRIPIQSALRETAGNRQSESQTTDKKRNFGDAMGDVHWRKPKWSVREVRQLRDVTICPCNLPNHSRFHVRYAPGQVGRRIGPRMALSMRILSPHGRPGPFGLLIRTRKAGIVVIFGRRCYKTSAWSNLLWGIIFLTNPY